MKRFLRLTAFVLVFAMLLSITPFSKPIIAQADEKTHGFNRVDDSPQIFTYIASITKP